MPTIKIRAANGATKEVEVTEENADILKRELAAGTISLAKQDTKNVIDSSVGASLRSTSLIPSLVEKMIGSRESNEELSKNPDMAPSKLVGDPLKRFGVGFGSGAIGGPGSAVGGGILNTIFGDTPETFSKAGIDMTGGALTGGLESKVPGGSMAKSALIKALIGGGGTYATGAANNAANVALDKDRTLGKDFNLPDSKAAILSGVMSGGASMLGDTASKMLQKTPTSQGALIQNEMTGSNITPPQLRESVQTNTNTSSNVRHEALSYQKQQKIQQLAQEKNISESKARELIAKEDLSEAKGLNKQDIGLTKNKTLEANPIIDQAKETISTSDAEMKRLASELKASVNKPGYAQESVRIQDEYRQHQDAKLSAQQQLASIEKQNQARASDVLLKRHEVVQSDEGQIFSNPEAAKNAESNIYKERKLQAKSEENLRTIKRNIDNTKYGIEVAPIIKGSKNTEDMVNKLINSDSFVIEKFMKTVGKDFPDIQKRVVGDMLRQSWDGQSFGNFTKLYGMEGTSGNPLPRLAAVLGDKTKAQNILEAVEVMDKGLAINSKLETGAKYLLGAGATTAILALSGSHVSNHYAAYGAAEGATILALSIPKVLDKVSQNKTLYDPFKKWAESGFNIANMTRPLYQALMDSGDHYRVDDFGNPELIKK